MLAALENMKKNGVENSPSHKNLPTKRFGSVSGPQNGGCFSAVATQGLGVREGLASSKLFLWESWRFLEMGFWQNPVSVKMWFNVNVHFSCQCACVVPVVSSCLPEEALSEQSHVMCECEL